MSEWHDAHTQEEKITFWQELQALLYSVLAQCPAGVPTDVVKEVREYVAHNELGLAWETLCEALIEFDEILAAPARHTFLEAGWRMGFAQPASANYDRWITITTHFTKADLRDGGEATGKD